DPYSARAPRIVSGDHVHAETYRLGQVQSLLDRADYLRGRIAAGLQVQIGGRDAGRLAHRTRGVAGGRQTELARRIAVEQVAREHPLVQHVLARGRQPLAVERLGAKTAGDQRVVHDRNAGAAIVLPSCPTRNDAPLYNEGPEAAPTIDRINPAAMSGSKTIGARIVLILRAPSRRIARRAAVIPTSSASSSFPKRRFDVYQNPCCIASPSCAIGCTTSVYEVPEYSPEKPWLLANRIWPRPELNSAPSEFFMRGSNFSAAFSAVRAISSARSAVTIPLSGSASESSGNDLGCIKGSGNPAHGSAADRRASSTVFAMKSPSESRSSSAVDKVAEDCPQNTRRPSRRSRELLSFSTSPSRTPAERDSAVTHRTSAALAPLRLASSSAQLASSISTVAIR